MLKCEHGCGNDALYETKGGKKICSKSSNSCPAVRVKNSKGLRVAYETGIRKPASEVYTSLSEEKKSAMLWNKGHRNADFSYGGKGQHKSALIFERGHRCECCGLTDWQGNPITLEMEHIDADKKNNTRDNLKLLCPNCHAQTPTWKRGKQASGWRRKRYTDEQMIDAITSSTCLNQVLDKLDLRYGSAGTIINVMSKYNVRYSGGVGELAYPPDLDSGPEKAYGFKSLQSDQLL